MLIQLTNATPIHKGRPIVINTDMVVSIFSDNVTRGESEESVTFVHMPPHGTWEVTESVEEIMKLIKSANKLNNFSITHKV
jgi:hypothetical protein